MTTTAQSANRPTGSTAADGPDAEPVRRLGRVGLTWRIVAAVAGTLLVAWGTFLGNDVYWPFAPMSQFAFRVGHDDSILSTYLQARTVTGQLIVVPINTPSLDVGRAEVEGQLPAFQRDPTLLRDLIAPYGRLHPGKPALAQAWLKQRVTVLHDGRKAGVYDQTLVGWPVDGPLGRQPAVGNE
jgi:hypothetical protein